MSVARMVSWNPFGIVAFLFAFAVDMVILPIWLIWLGCQLRGLSAHGMYMASTEKAAEMQATGSASTSDTAVRDLRKDASVV